MKKINFDKRLLIGLTVFASFQLLLAWGSKSDESGQKNNTPEAVDTFVPLGFTLVPIQIENHDELQSLVDKFAIVDLHKKGVPDVIASGVRLLRSPRNPDVFAVLVEQDQGRDLISVHGAQFTVSLKNPDSKPNKIKPKRTIVRN